MSLSPFSSPVKGPTVKSRQRPAVNRNGAPQPRRDGLSYWRFSGNSQEHGDSQVRQERDFQRFCDRHNLTPLRTVYADRGRSGWTDEHRKKGQLGDLIAAAKNDAFAKGTV